MSEGGGWYQPEGSSRPGETSGPAPQTGWGPPPGAPGPGAAPPGWGALRPGIIPLRPLRLGEIYDGAFAAVRSNPASILGASAVIAVIVAAINGVATWVIQHEIFHVVSTSTSSLFSPGPTSAGTSAESTTEQLDQLSNQLTSLVPTLAVAILLGLLASAVLSGVVTVSVSAGVLGRRVRGQALWQQVRPRLVPLVGLALLTTLIVTLAAAVCLTPGGIVLAIGASSGSSGTLVGGAVLLFVGGLLALAAALALQTRLLLAPCALILEPQPVRAAMARSWALTRRGFWRLLGIQLLTSVGLAVVAGIVSVPFSLVGGAAGVAFGADSAGRTIVPLISSGIGTAIASTILDPLQAAVVALLYIDARMRREGLDVELGQAAVAAAQAAASPA